MRDLEERTPPETVVDDTLAFAVFALTHAACSDVTEVRVGERWILGWCLSCAAMRAFFSPEG